MKPTAGATARGPLIAACLAALVIAGYFQFPGHVYLQSDTQIYAPILEHLQNPALFRKELIVEYPHVSLTLYDECALLLRKLTGLDLERALAIPHLVTRFLGLAGFYLMASAAGLSPPFALFVTACLSLGANIPGPSVLVFEYEPVPRGFAVPLVYLAVGLAAHKRWLGAGIAASAGFLFHPPSTYPFWGAFAILMLWPGDRKRRSLALIPLVCAMAVLFAASGGVGSQSLFRKIEPLEESLQRLRASYVWVSNWAPAWMPHYAVLLAVLGLALSRIRSHTSPELRLFAAAMPLIGIASVPVSYLLLERGGFSLMPQFQPARALLFVAVMTVFAAAAAGCWAVTGKRHAEAAVWFAIAYAIPARVKFSAPPTWKMAAVVAGLALAAAIGKRTALAVAALAAFFVIPLGVGFRNYPALEHEELRGLSKWAREATPVDSVFLFPDAARDLHPGIFRARALRAVYVDWKAGGQVNFFKAMGEEWWKRWQAAMTRPPDFALYRTLGIDYVVVQSKHAIAGKAPAFENSAYRAYRVED